MDHTALKKRNSSVKKTPAYVFLCMLCKFLLKSGHSDSPTPQGLTIFTSWGLQLSSRFFQAVFAKCILCCAWWLKFPFCYVCGQPVTWQRSPQISSPRYSEGSCCSPRRLTPRPESALAPQSPDQPKHTSPDYGGHGPHCPLWLQPDTPGRWTAVLTALVPEALRVVDGSCSPLSYKHQQPVFITLL